MSKQYTATVMPTLHWCSFVECIERVSCWSWTNRPYVCSYCGVYNWPHSKLLLTFDAVVWGRIWFYLMRHFAFRIHHNNVNNDLSLICVGWMYGPGVIGVWYSMRFYFTLMWHFAFRIHYNCVSSCWLWTNRSYVCIAVSVYCLAFEAKFECVIAWRSIQYEVAISPLCAILLSDGNDGSALVFAFCWMYGTGVVLALNQQLVRVYCCCVCLNLKMLGISVRYNMRS